MIWWLVVAIVSLGLLAWPVGLAVRRHRRRERLKNAPTPRDQLAGCWTELVNRARELGFVLPEAMTRAQMAEEIVAAQPVAVDVRWLASEIDLALFGTDAEQSAQSITQRQLDAAWAASRRIVRQLAGTMRLRRRLLAMASPAFVSAAIRRRRRIEGREAAEAAAARWAPWGPVEQARAMGFYVAGRGDPPVETDDGETGGTLTIRVRHALPSRHRSLVGDNG